MLPILRRTLIWLLPVLLLILAGGMILPSDITLAQQDEPATGYLSIPDNNNEQDLDGVCGSFETEYAGALIQTFTDANGATGRVYLRYDSSTGRLYVCIEGTLGELDERFMSVYLDPQGDGANYVFANNQDYSLRVTVEGSQTKSLNGTDVANGYVAAPAFDNPNIWQAVAGPGPQQGRESAEYSINYERFGIAECEIFGMATYHHWVNSVGDDYGWPSNKFFDQPRTWQPVKLDGPPCGDPQIGQIAYVYRSDTASANSFFNLLTANGYTVDLIPLNNVLGTNFANYDLTIIADDTGFLGNWGIPGQTANQVNQIIQPNLPILGLGEGGYAFFGQLSLFIGWPNGWHGPEDEVIRAPGAPPAYYNGIGPDPVQVYTEPVNEVGIYLDDNPLPPGVVPVGLEPPNPDHASLIIQDCRHLWGFSGNPLEMTGPGPGSGQNLFLNAVQYARFFQCSPPTQTPEPCVSIEKTANPPAGTPVAPGDVIEYTVTYVYSNNPDCNNPDAARLLDYIPPDTIYVPGSASGGGILTADGALVWPVTPAPGPQTVTFKVRVSDTQCVNQQTVNNQARLIINGSTVIPSNLVSHPVECPDIQFPNDKPPYAEDEIQITPYPLVTGQPSTISVKVSNASSQPKTVTVSFQTSPSRFGIGLPFNTFDSKVVTIPANGNVIVTTTFTPVASGHYCIQIVVEDENGQRVVTQRNLDVTENLTPGETDDLEFEVGNPTANTADVQLVVDNTCPGWTATVSPAVLTNMAPGEVRTATLSVTPPNPVTLGTACHIDVQGWIGDQLIGGIRKLDVPPVQLPTEVNPPWMEPEISVIPDPPVAGQPAQICVELQNPLNVPRQVTIEYAVADFGAGVWFTPVGTQTFTLPPNSIDKYCINWTPTPGGTLHRCIQVTLKQANYMDQKSQRNVDLEEPTVDTPIDTVVDFHIGNTAFISQELVVEVRRFGIHPDWQVILEDMEGNPLPPVLGPGQILEGRLRFVNNTSLFQVGQTEAAFFGDESWVEVSVQLNGEEVGGFTADLGSPGQTPESVGPIYLPFVSR